MGNINYHEITKNFAGLKKEIKKEKNKIENERQKARIRRERKNERENTKLTLLTVKMSFSNLGFIPKKYLD